MSFTSGTLIYATDITLEATLVHVHLGGGETTLGAVTLGPPNNGVFTDVPIPATALDAACGDRLALRIHYASGASKYYDLYVDLTTP